MKKKLIAVLLTASMFAGILAGCGSSTAEEQPVQRKEKLSIFIRGITSFSSVWRRYIQKWRRLRRMER